MAPRPSLPSPLVLAFGLAAVSFLGGCRSLVGLLTDSGSASHESADPRKKRNLHPGETGYVDPGPWVGPLAQKYAGQVVFSRKPIAKDATDDADIYAGTYPLGEPLYLRYWAAESAHNLYPSCKTPRLILRSDVNGEHAGKASPYLPSFGHYVVGADALNERGYSSLSNELEVPFTKAIVLDASERATASDATVRTFNGDVIPRLREGDNDLRILVSLDCGSSDKDDPIVAEGHIKVTVAAGGVKAYLAKFGPRLAPSPHPENATLVPQILAAMKKKPDWDNEELVGARVTSKGWIPIRNKLTGILVEQQVDAVLVVHSRKETRPDACRVFDMAYRRDASGGDLYFAGTGSSSSFPCGSAPK